MMILAKWSPGVKRLSPRALILLSWRPGTLHFLVRSPGALNLLGTQKRGLVSKETGVLRRWGTEIRTFELSTELMR